MFRYIKIHIWLRGLGELFVLLWSIENHIYPYKTKKENWTVKCASGNGETPSWPVSDSTTTILLCYFLNIDRGAMVQTSDYINSNWVSS